MASNDAPTLSPEEILALTPEVTVMDTASESSPKSEFDADVEEDVAFAKNVANFQKTKFVEEELNRKSQCQARADDLGHFDQQWIDKHDFCSTYAVSRGELLVAEKWRCVRKIAFGSTSIVYLSFSIDFEKVLMVKFQKFN
jgi:hypothetical protein